MAIYRPGEVNCGHCNEPTGLPADDWAGETRTDDGEYVASVEPCVRCAVHTYGALTRCPDCAENNDDAQGIGTTTELITT